METYTKISDTRLLISASTDLLDADGNQILDADSNPIQSIQQSLMTIDEINQDLVKHTGMLSVVNNQLADAQKRVDAEQASVDLDNARLEAFNSPSTLKMSDRVSNKLQAKP